MRNLITVLRVIRAKFNRTLFPFKGYWMATRSLKPISTKFGYDRGNPIDRFWIEDFLNKNKTLIFGHCLEVTDSAYLTKFGEDKIGQIDVLDLNKTNKNATIYGDLRDLKDVINSNVYDCIILTHVLGLIDDIESAISEIHRILKPGGTVLVTSSCISPTYDSTNYWRFTSQGATYLFSKFFDKSDFEVSTYGNALTGQCFWLGISQEDLTKEELEYNDPQFPCVITIKATKSNTSHE